MRFLILLILCLIQIGCIIRESQPDIPFYKRHYEHRPYGVFKTSCTEKYMPVYFEHQQQAIRFIKSGDNQDTLYVSFNSMKQLREVIQNCNKYYYTEELSQNKKHPIAIFESNAFKNYWRDMPSFPTGYTKNLFNRCFEENILRKHPVHKMITERGINKIILCYRGNN